MYFTYAKPDPRIGPTKTGKYQHMTQGVVFPLGKSLEVKEDAREYKKLCALAQDNEYFVASEKDLGLDGEKLAREYEEALEAAAAEKKEAQVPRPAKKKVTKKKASPK